MNKKLLLVLILFITFAGNILANSYNAQLTTRVSKSSAGMGKVYAVACDSVYKGEFSADSSSHVAVLKAANQPVAFNAYAETTNDDMYAFLGWSEEEDGAIISAANPFQINVMSSSSATQSNVKVLYANFLEKTENNITLIVPTHGQYTATDSIVTRDEYGTMVTREKIYFTAIPDEGYKLMGWYTYNDKGEKSYFSYENDAYKTFIKDSKVGADFVKVETPVFAIRGDDKLYTDINSANADAQEGDVITLVSDGEIVAGNYTISKGVTLLVPFDDDNTCYTGIELPLSSYNYVEPIPYRTLTLLDGAHLTIDGALSISSDVFAVNTRIPPASSGGHVNGEYGNMVMKKGSSMTVSSGAFLYAYGYILGEGNVTAKNGATIYETFQMSEFRGGTALDRMSEGDVTVFPINQYFIQNIEVPLTFEYGAVEMVTSGFSVESKALVMEPFVFIGEKGMFILGEGATLTKYFDPEHDRQMYELDGDASFGGIELQMNGIIVKSKNYVLPLTNNLSVLVNSGTLTLNQPNGFSLLPDAQLTIGKDAKMIIKNSKLYVYDSDSWGEYTGIRKEGYYHLFTPIKSPSMSYVRTSLSDATLDIKGAVVTENGALYTTGDGANVCCSEGRGQITFNNCALDYYTYEIEQDGTEVKFVDIPITNAKLKNASSAENEYTLTDKVEAGTTYYFHKETGVWDTDEIPVSVGTVTNTNRFAIYNVNGLKMNTLNTGVNIVKMYDGSVRKVMK